MISNRGRKPLSSTKVQEIRRLSEQYSIRATAYLARVATRTVQKYRGIP